ncbi:MAG: hypothetical protein GWN84_15440, partial [Gammaproteobacteria bacterium]|nr:hypothetical protein [Gammaproteobacteria bacterium]NIV52278.1 hypothetical protein [Gammaproteobacteria bacterium]
RPAWSSKKGVLLLAYREDFHGRVSKWLRDVLVEARDRELPGPKANCPEGPPSAAQLRT